MATKIEGDSSRSDRSGKRIIASHFEIEIVRAFKMLAAEQLKTTDGMLHKAVELVLKEYKKPIPTVLSHKLKKLGFPE
jgi:hypothetical protein